MPGSNVESRRVLYAGNVQGVGFRYTARRLAGGFPITGFVRNLPDGRVELVAEGSPTELDRFLQAIAAAMQGNIRSSDVEKSVATGQYTSFEVGS
jgi:acylphosphatase